MVVPYASMNYGEIVDLVDVVKETRVVDQINVSTPLNLAFNVDSVPLLVIIADAGSTVITLTCYEYDLEADSISVDGSTLTISGWNQAVFGIPASAFNGTHTIIRGEASNSYDPPENQHTDVLVFDIGVVNNLPYGTNKYAWLNTTSSVHVANRGFTTPVTCTWSISKVNTFTNKLPTHDAIVNHVSTAISTALTNHHHDSSYAAINHHHDSSYAAINHNHDSSYAAINHHHDSSYAAINHHHDSSYAAINHHHDSSYAAINHHHDSSYAAINHHHDSSYAAINHHHDSSYAAINHHHDSDYVNYNNGNVSIPTLSVTGNITASQNLSVGGDLDVSGITNFDTLHVPTAFTVGNYSTGAGLIFLYGTTRIYNTLRIEDSNDLIASGDVDVSGNLSVNGTITTANQLVANGAYFNGNVDIGSTASQRTLTMYGPSTFNGDITTTSALYASSIHANSIYGTSTGNVPLPNGTPSTNDVVQWDGSNWTFAPLSGGSGGSFLPLSGGTLTGALNGVSMTLSGNLTCSDVNVTGNWTGSGIVTFNSTRAQIFAVNTMSAFKTTADEILGDTISEPISCQAYTDSGDKAAIQGTTHASGYHLLSPNGARIHDHLTANYQPLLSTGTVGQFLMVNSSNEWVPQTYSPSVSLDTDHVHVGTFGAGNSTAQARIGFINNHATFAYYDVNSTYNKFNATDYALQQQSSGVTTLNAPSGTSVNICINHTNVASFDSGSCIFYQYMWGYGSKNVTLSRIKYVLINYGGYWVAPEGQVNSATTASTSLSLRLQSGCYASTYYQSSDDRRKHNEAKFADGDGLRIINKLQPLIYEKTDRLYEDGETRDPEEDYTIEAGFIAQEVLKVPELAFAVRGGDYVDEAGQNVTQEYSLDYQSIWTVAVKAIQDLSAEVTQLKARISQLEGN